MKPLPKLGIVLTIMTLSNPLLQRVEADNLKAGKTFEQADQAFVEGNFTLGEQILNDLISANPGNFELAISALHRMCLSEYLELIDNDWPSQGYPNQMFNKAGKDHDEMWALISEYLREGFLEVGKFAREGDRYPADPRENPFLLESLWREKQDFPLTPKENISDTASMRLLTLQRAGYLEADDPAVIDASVLLVFLRRSQKRHHDAARLIDELVAAQNQHVDWLLARARFHAKARSPRTNGLSRELHAKFDRQAVDPIVAKAARRAEYFDISDVAPTHDPMIDGRGWMGQLAHDDEKRAWERLATGLVNGLEEQIDLWIQGTFSDEQNRVYLMRKDGTGSAMIWQVLDDQLKSLGAGALDNLRSLQEERCKFELRTKKTAKLTQRERLKLFRRFPWAMTAHLVLMDYAKKELEAGRGQSARNGFRDVREHAEDPILIKKSKVGTWLAIAQEQDYGALSELFSEIDPDEQFPWMGKAVTKREIRERLMHDVTLPKNETKSPALSELAVRFLKMPPRPLWPNMRHRSSPGLAFVNLQNVGSRVLASTRKTMAFYDAKNGSKPIWVDSGSGGQWGNSISRPGRFRPLVKGNKIYSRWGYNADPRKLIARDADSREILWSMDATGPSDARRKIPLGNPVLSGGQIYLASAWDKHKSTGGLNLRLSSLDAATGKANWHADLYLQAMQNFFEGVFGESLTIRDGSIYCSPSTGFLGRFDIRDGKMEWMYNYDSSPANQLTVDTLGSAPEVVGNVVIGLPRDTNVMFGLDKRTGKVLWSSSLLLPKKIIGSADGKILVYGISALTALDALTGKIYWNVIHPEKIIAQPTLQDSTIYLAAGKQLYRYDAATGIAQESISLPKTKNTIRKVAVLKNELYLITDEPSSEDENPLIRRAHGGIAWEITAKDPRLYVTKQKDTNQSSILIHEGEMLHCLEAKPSGGILWQRFVYPRPHDLYFIEDKVVLVYNKGRYDVYLKALDQKTGNLEWELTLLRLRAGHGGIYGRTGKYLYGRDNSDRYTLVDLNIGKVIRQDHISRKNGTAKAGLGGGQVQFLISTAYNRALHWLRWDLSTGKLDGGNQVLRGANGDPMKAFERNWLEFAKFGSHACYFICRDENQGRQRIAYQANYKDRAVRLVGKNPRNLRFEPPFLFMQQEETAQNKKNRTHTWTIQREDEPSYSHSLELPHSWQHRPTFANGHLLEVRTPIKNQNPYTVRLHDLSSKKPLLTHTSENTERMGGVQAGKDKILVFEYKRENRNTETYFKFTPYDINSGQASPTIEINYSNAHNQQPTNVQVVGELVLVTDKHSVKAWPFKM